MSYACIKDQSGSLIGSIEQSGGGYRIVWKERMENAPGNVHRMEHEIYPTTEEARQEVYRISPNSQIIET